VAIALVALVAIGLAIPVFLSNQPPANRNVVLPTTLLGQQQIHDANLDQASAAVVAGLERDLNGVTQVQSAYYGLAIGGPQYMVAAGKLPRRPTAADTKAFFSTTANSESDQLVFTPMGSGPFGGKMECGTATLDGTPTTVCASLDSAAAVIVITEVMTPSELAVQTRLMISSIEQKG
jgi:hypothetical protein